MQPKQLEVNPDSFSPTIDSREKSGVLQAEEQDLAQLILDREGRSDSADKLEIGMSLAGISGVWELQTKRSLDAAVSGAQEESPAEKQAIADLVDSARSVVVSVMSGKAETKLGRKIEDVTNSRRRRMVGRLATAAVIGAGAYYAHKGIDSAIGLIPSGGAALVGVKMVGSRVAPGLVNAFKGRASSKVKNMIDRIDPARMREIDEEAQMLPEEEAVEYKRQMVAEELLTPLKNQLKLLAFDTDLTGESHDVKDELAHKMTQKTAEFISDMYSLDPQSKGVEDSTRKNRIDATTEVAKSVVSKVPIAGPAGDVFKDTIAEAGKLSTTA